MAAAFLAGAFFLFQERLWGIFGSKNGRKKVEIEGVRPIWRAPERNSASNPASDVQNGLLATRLVTKRCDLGSLGVPGPASTPWALGPGLFLGSRSRFFEEAPN